MDGAATETATAAAAATHVQICGIRFEGWASGRWQGAGAATETETVTATSFPRQMLINIFVSFVCSPATASSLRFVNECLCSVPAGLRPRTRPSPPQPRQHHSSLPSSHRCRIGINCPFTERHSHAMRSRSSASPELGAL